VLETRLTYLSNGIVFGEVCITLAARCLCAPLFYLEGLVILQDHTNHVCGVATDGVLEGTRAAAFWPETQ
jgi:hypothetical protein